MIKFEQFDLAKNADGLLPAIVQDDSTLQVLMLGYMTREAFEKTLSTGRVTFWSRTRKELWTKGDTSGNYLELKSMHADCDADTLLVRAIPHGPTCHLGARNCFQTAETEGFIRYLGDVVKRRHTEMPEDSYTTKLFTKGVDKIAQKVGEEVVETIIEAVAARRDGFLYEASDLIYHLLVLLEQMGCSIDDIEKELAARHK